MLAAAVADHLRSLHEQPHWLSVKLGREYVLLTRECSPLKTINPQVEKGTTAPKRLGFAMDIEEILMLKSKR